MAAQWLLKKHFQKTKISFFRKHIKNFCYRKIAEVFFMLISQVWQLAGVVAKSVTENTTDGLLGEWLHLR
jgi:hypothetical protein